MIGKGIFLVLFLTIGGSIAFNLEKCNMDECEVTSPAKDFERLNWMPPNGEQLKLLCPKTLLFLQCVYDEIKDCTGHDIGDLASSDNETISTMFTTIMSVGSLVDDICDESTLIHEGYVSSVSCFVELIKGTDNTCHEEGVAVYHSYRASLELLEDESDKRREREESRCMITAYTLACFSTQLQKACGEVARSTFVQFLQRVKVLRLNDCSEGAALVLKNAFLDFLDFEEEQASLFSEVFNALKRRR